MDRTLPCAAMSLSASMTLPRAVKPFSPTASVSAGNVSAPCARRTASIVGMSALFFFCWSLFARMTPSAAETPIASIVGVSMRRLYTRARPWSVRCYDARSAVWGCHVVPVYVGSLLFGGLLIVASFFGGGHDTDVHAGGDGGHGGDGHDQSHATAWLSLFGLRF